MEWIFDGDVIEWRGPAPFIFVAMPPEVSEDVKQEAKSLVYWGQVPVEARIGETTLRRHCFPRTGAICCRSRSSCNAPRPSVRAGESPSRCRYAANAERARTQ